MLQTGSRNASQLAISIFDAFQNNSLLTIAQANIRKNYIKCVPKWNSMRQRAKKLQNLRVIKIATSRLQVLDHSTRKTQHSLKIQKKS
jgi:hypothetical protein